jgi:hypothetical protein
MFLELYLALMGGINNNIEDLQGEYGEEKGEATVRGTMIKCHDGKGKQKCRLKYFNEENFES